MQKKYARAYSRIALDGRVKVLALARSTPLPPNVDSFQIAAGGFG